MRQPAVTGDAETRVRCGLAARMPSEKTNFMFSSRPTVPLMRPRSARPLPRKANGLSSSCQTSTSASLPKGPAARSSRARPSSNAGQTRNGFALAGMTRDQKRSQPLRRRSAKYTDEVVELARMMASIFTLAINCWACAMRASRSPLVNGHACPFRTGNAAIAGGSTAASAAEACGGGSAADAARAAEAPRNPRRESGWVKGMRLRGDRAIDRDFQSNAWRSDYVEDWYCRLPPQCENTGMALEFTTSYLQDSLAIFRYYKALAERAMAQLTDEQLTAVIDEESNSIAVIV